MVVSKPVERSVVEYRGGELQSTETLLIPWRNLPATTGMRDELGDLFQAGDASGGTTLNELLPEVGAASAAVREALKNPDQIFRLVEGGMSPVKGGKDLLRGGVWKSGAEGKGMLEMAKFKQVGRAAALASTFFSQGMLIYVAHELNQIRKQLADIKTELFQSEVSRMKGCVRFAGTALRYYQKNREKGLVFNAIQSVETEIDPLADAILRKLNRTPSKTAFLGMSAADLKTAYIESREAVLWLLKGLVSLAVLYSVADPVFGKQELKRAFSELIANDGIFNWMDRAGRELTNKGQFGEEQVALIKNIAHKLKQEVTLLDAPRTGILISGRQILELENRVSELYN